MFEHIISLLFFAAAMQGFLLAGVLGLHKRNIQANHILAVWALIGGAEVEFLPEEITDSPIIGEKNSWGHL